MLKWFRILGLVGALSFLSPAFTSVQVWACGGETCEKCEGKTAGGPAQESKSASKVTQSGRKLKCSKCAGHGASENHDAKADQRGVPSA
ncbi:MAG: hypothetical protein RJB38_831 [Pseudomonadota bacterium]|jgi:hypothetical protein